MSFPPFQSLPLVLKSPVSLLNIYFNKLNFRVVLDLERFLKIASFYP